MANHGPTNMANQESTIMANQNNQNFGAKMQSRERNEEKFFSIKTIVGNFVFINEENKSKVIQGKNVLSFTKFVLGRGLVRGFLSRGLCLGPGEGTHDIFGQGCATIKSLYRLFLEFLTKKLDPCRNFCA